MVTHWTLLQRIARTPDADEGRQNFGRPGHPGHENQRGTLEGEAWAVHDEGSNRSPRGSLASAHPGGRVCEDDQREEHLRLHDPQQNAQQKLSEFWDGYESDTASEDFAELKRVQAGEHDYSDDGGEAVEAVAFKDNVRVRNSKGRKTRIGTRTEARDGDERDTKYQREASPLHHCRLELLCPGRP